MKAQFKYTFLEGLHARCGVFAVIFIMNLVFILLGSLGMLPYAAQIVAVSLGGTAIAVMFIVNIISDVSIIRRMYSAPRGYLYALTPVPRRKTLLASLITMAVMDIVTMAVAIASVVWTSLILAGNYYSVWGVVRDAISSNTSEVLFGLWYVALLIIGYLLIMIFIMFCITIRKSVFYNKPAGGIMTALLGVATFYIGTLMTFVLAPFGTVYRSGMFFNITIGRAGLIAYVFLILIQAAALFYITSDLMERKLNI